MQRIKQFANQTYASLLHMLVCEIIRIYELFITCIQQFFELQKSKFQNSLSLLKKTFKIHLNIYWFTPCMWNYSPKLVMNQESGTVHDKQNVYPFVSKICEEKTLRPKANKIGLGFNHLFTNRGHKKFWVAITKLGS